MSLSDRPFDESFDLSRALLITCEQVASINRGCGKHIAVEIIIRDSALRMHRHTARGDINRKESRFPLAWRYINREKAPASSVDINFPDFA